MLNGIRTIAARRQTYGKVFDLKHWELLSPERRFVSFL